MFYSLRSQIYKLRKTPLLWLAVLWPIGFVGAFKAYYSVAAWSPELEMTGYFQALSLGMSCLITLFCTCVAQQEQRAGNWFNFLAVGKSRMRTLISVFILASVWTGVGMLLASWGLCHFWGGMPPHAYVLTTILMFIPLPCLIWIQLFIFFKFGVSWSVGAGAVFLLVGALSITGLFDRFWYYVPSAWAPRFTSLMVADVFYPERIISIAGELRFGLLICLLATVITAVLVHVWFCRWDGRVGSENE